MLMSTRRSIGCVLTLAILASANAAEAADAEYRVDNCSAPDGTDSIAVEATHVPANRVLADLVRLKHLRVRHAEKMTAAALTLHFKCVGVRDVMAILADASGHGLVAQPDGEGGYKIGTLAHHDAIETLRNEVTAGIEAGDKAKEKLALEKIVALAKQQPVGDVEENLSDEYASLDEIANGEKDYARAEEYDRARLAQIERLNGTDNDDYALALADLAHTRGNAGKSDAVDLLKRAVAMMEKHPGRDTSPALAHSLANLAVLAFEAGRNEEADALSERAYAAFTTPDQTEWNPLELYRARIAVVYEEETLGDGLVQRDRENEAAAHFERVLPVAENLNGEDFFRTEHDRDMVALLSEKAEPLAHAGDRFAHRIAEAKKDDVSKDYATTLFDLALVRAKQERYADAIEAWHRLVELRRHYRGPQGAEVISALDDLALLERLDARASQATATERDADALHTDAAPKSVRLVGGLEDELRKNLAPLLKRHFDARIAAAEAQQSSDKTLARLREQRGYCMATLARLYDMSAHSRATP
ncbi:MAG TPA: tetratricopeptide repeat protein [Rudaea sp.]|nr:tetratricopeptide repeat protein [Rudaea sp.]